MGQTSQRTHARLAACEDAAVGYGLGMTPERLQRFEANRRRLFGVAYRMLGEASEAEDVVQDAYLRWERHDTAISPEAWLTKVVTNLCLDRLNSARVRRESYVGPWLPEP